MNTASTLSMQHETTTQSADKSRYDVTSKAMLVKLEISAWAGHKFDSKLSSEVTTKHGAQKDMARVNKRLLPRECFAEITEAESSLKTTWKKFTLPWRDDGRRILPTVKWFEYCEAMREGVAKHALAVANFETKYPEFRDRELSKAGTLLKYEEFPPVDAIKGKFKVAYRDAVKLTRSEDIRFELNDLDLARVRQETEERHNEDLKRANADIYDRTRKALERVSERMDKFGKVIENPAESEEGTEQEIDPGSEDLTTEATGKRKRKPRKASFHDSLIANIIDLANLIPALNFTQDPALDELVDKIRNVAKYAPETLRKDATAREKTKATADEILAQISQFV